VITIFFVSYSPRQGELAVLRLKLLAGDESVAITGMGGIGKTVLASALTHDPGGTPAFPDGSYWLTVGQKTALLDLQAELFPQRGRKLRLWTDRRELNFRFVVQPPQQLLVA
jgi:hypothetical protein